MSISADLSKGLVKILVGKCMAALASGHHLLGVRAFGKQYRAGRHPAEPGVEHQAGYRRGVHGPRLGPRVFTAGIRTREGNGRRSAAESPNNQNRGWISCPGSGGLKKCGDPHQLLAASIQRVLMSRNFQSSRDSIGIWLQAVSVASGPREMFKGGVGASVALRRCALPLKPSLLEDILDLSPNQLWPGPLGPRPSGSHRP